MSGFVSAESNSTAVGSSSSDSLTLLETLQTQQKTVMAGLSRELVKDDVWYLIAMPWFELWKRYVGQSRGVKAGDPSQHPGKIDNTSILDSNGCLKRNLDELGDYTAVPEDCWKILENYYGVADSKTPVRRCVIVTGLYSKVAVIELYPLTISVCHHENLPNLQPVIVSRSSTIDELIASLRQRFSIPADQEAQLWLKLKSLQVVDLLTGKGASTLEQLNVVDDSLFILETRRPGDAWMSSNQEFVKKAAEALGAEIKVPELTSSTSGQRFGTVSSTGATSGPTQPAYVTRSWTWGGLFNSGSRDEVDGVAGRTAGTKGLCGLQNLGNTCFMNSALQCLSNVADLTEFFVCDEYKSQINKENPLGMKGELAERYAALIKAMWSEKYGSVAPREFKSTVGDYAPRFHGYAQQDSSELLSFLLDGLHEDLNRVKKKPYYEIKDDEKMPDEVRAKEYWDYYRKRNDSKIVDLFHGQLKSTLRCNVCAKVVSIFDPFCYLSLPLPRRDTRPLNVYFRFADPKLKVSKLQVVVSRQYTANDVRTAVAKATGVPAEKICISGLSMARGVTMFYRDNDSPRFDEREEAMAFEVPECVNPDPSHDEVPIVVYVKSADSLRAFPFLVFVSRHHTTPFALHQAVWDLLRPFERQEVENQDGGESGDDDNEPDFRLRLVNSAGTMVLDEFDCSDNVSLIEKLRLGSTHYVVMSWKNVAIERRLNTVALESIDSHSLQAVSGAASLLMPNSGGLNLAECINSFLAEEQLSAQDTWYCPSCKQHQRAFKKFDLWRLPPYLIIHLKRFQQQRWRVEKMDTLVHYPCVLDMSDFVLNATEKENPDYNLVAVSNHYGGIGGGHYTAYAFNKTTKRWYTFDDSSVTPMSEDQVMSKAGYLLVYKRKSLDADAQPRNAAAGNVVTVQPGSHSSGPLTPPSDDNMDTS